MTIASPGCAGPAHAVTADAAGQAANLYAAAVAEGRMVQALLAMVAAAICRVGLVESGIRKTPTSVDARFSVRFWPGPFWFTMFTVAVPASGSSLGTTRLIKLADGITL